MESVKNGIWKWLYRAAWAAIIVMGLLTLHYLRRIYLCDLFVVPTESMSPTLLPGDRILVDKRIFGARIYERFDFAPGAPLVSRRTRGRRAIRPGDVVVFNHPQGYGRDRIEFRINFVYAKRVVGAPGDSIRIEEGFYRNDRFPGTIGLEDNQQMLRILYDSSMAEKTRLFMPYRGEPTGWTIRNAGPLLVPAAGAEVEMTRLNYLLYARVIEYETGCELAFDDTAGQVLMDGEPLSRYRFSNDYYFMGGDRVTNSNDSRYWGFVPEAFIVGMVSRVCYSAERPSGRIRWNRIWKRVE